VWLAVYGIASLVILVGCASSDNVVQRADKQAQDGQVIQGLETIRKALHDSPNDPQLRSAYLRIRDNEIQSLLRLASAARTSDPDGAKLLIDRVRQLDPENARAPALLAALDDDRRQQQDMRAAEEAWHTNDGARARTLIRGVLLRDPTHSKALALLKQFDAQPAGVDEATAEATRKLQRQLQQPITLQLKDAAISQVFEVLGKTTSLSFVFDRDVRLDQKISLSMVMRPVREVIEAVMLSSQLEQRLLSTGTILIYPNTPAKLKEFQPLVMRTFFLNNGDVDTVASSIKTLVKTRDLVVDKKQNMIVMRDSVDAVRIAERLVSLHDLPEPEVMLELEILEINRSRLTELGVKLPDSATLSPLPGTAGGTLTLADIRQLGTSTIGVSVSPLTLNARLQDADVKLLANPRIRAKNRETAKVLIGDKVPNITSTSTSTGFVAESVQYLDVGLKLDITPTISIDNEVAIKVALEVSNIANQIKTSAGTLAYQIGTRTASTVLRLRDGENQVLAGLISDEDRRAASGLPGLARVPLAGRLFSSTLDEARSTEIVLSITPRLVRNLKRPEPSLLEFDTGTESAVRDNSPGTTGITDRQARNSDTTGTSSTSVSESGRPSANGSPQQAQPLQADSETTAQRTTPDARTDSLRSGTAQNHLALEVVGAKEIGSGAAEQFQLLLKGSIILKNISYVLTFDPRAIEILDFSEEGKASGENNSATSNVRVDKGVGRVFVSNQQLQQSAVEAGQLSSKAVSVLTVRGIAIGRTWLQITSASAMNVDGATVAIDLADPWAVVVK
jgi:general secretion pathway protein D